MSAFVVDDRHIDVMLKLALDGPGDGFTIIGHSFSWLRDPDASWAESNRYGKLDHENANDIGALLLAENVASVNARYQENASTPEYTYRQPLCRIEAVEGLKAISCYEYQSCEHEGWDGSEAKRFCEALRDDLIGELPGMSDAPWEWSEAHITAKREAVLSS